MKKLFLLFFVLQIFVLAQDLPHYMTQEEKELYKNYNPQFLPTEFTNPPASPVRTNAEWEEVQGIVITWTSFTTILREIVRHAQKEGLVFIVCSDSNTVKSNLTSGGVPLVNLKFIIAPFNSIWVRDYGPWSVYTNDVDSLLIIDWVYNRPRPSDDNIPTFFANLINRPLYQTTVNPYRLIATGGNFMVDGHGTGFSSKLILNENPDKTPEQISNILNLFMGIDRYIKMENLPFDQIHHIDMHMKLLDEETLMVGEYPPGISDGPQIEANLQYVLNNYLTCFGRPYKVVRIPMPPDAQGRYPSNGGHYRTYTNSVIINKTVIIPTYEEQYDTTAFRIYREAMPGYTIVGINSNQIIPSLGTIHCITKEVGVDEPIFISHPKILSVTVPNPFNVGAKIKTKSGVSNAYVYWSTDTSSGYNSLQMNYFGNDSFAVSIPVQDLGTKVFYYISAVSNSGKTINKPLVAPAGTFQFTVDAVVPVELISFSGEYFNGSVNLVWNTASETNNMGFEVQRTIKNEKLKISNWESIGFVEGKGTTTEINNYFYSDNSVYFGNYKYRLKQIDFDGSFSFSNEIEINIIPNEFSLSQNYPNPFNPSTEIRYQITEESKVSLKVFDVLGKEVATLINEMKEAGSYQVQFNSNNLSSGIYYYTFIAAPSNAPEQVFVTTKKMVLMK